MALRIKKAVPGRFVGGRFVPNPKKSSIEEVLYRKFRKEGYSRAEAKRFAKINAPYFGGAKNPKSKIKTKVVKRGAYWFAEMESGGGSSSARYDTKREAQKAVRDYRYIHRTGRFPR